MEEYDKMIDYIYQNNGNIVIDKGIIINFLTENDILYSINNNGIFINISLLSGEIIVKLYNLVQMNINNVYNDDDYDEKYNNNISELINIQHDETKVDTGIQVYKELKLTKLQIDLLTYS